MADEPMDLGPPTDSDVDMKSASDSSLSDVEMSSDRVPDVLGNEGTEGGDRDMEIQQLQQEPSNNAADLGEPTAELNPFPGNAIQGFGLQPCTEPNERYRDSTTPYAFGSGFFEHMNQENQRPSSENIANMVILLLLLLLGGRSGSP